MSNSTQKDWPEYSDEDLLAEAKKQQKYKVYDAVIVGFLVGVALYSIYNHGFGLLMFLPLVYIPVAGKNHKKRKKVEKAVAERNLQSDE